MEDVPIADAAQLHTGAALPAALRVVVKGFFSDAVCLHALGQHGCIFQRHAGPLCHEGPHRMRRIPQQRHPALRHLGSRAHWRTVAQRPQAPVFDGFRHADHRRGSTGQRCAQMACIGRMVPVLQVVRTRPLHQRHHVHVAASAHGILHNVHAIAQPGRHLAAAQRRRQTVLSHQSAIRQNAAVARSCFARQHLPAHLTPQPIGADQHLCPHGLGSCRPCHGAGRQIHGQPALLQTFPALHLALQQRLHGILLLHLLQQQLVQVGAVDGRVRRSVAQRKTGIEVQRAQRIAIGRITHTQQLRKRRNALQAVTQPPTLEHPHHVGT